MHVGKNHLGNAELAVGDAGQSPKSEPAVWATDANTLAGVPGGRGLNGGSSDEYLMLVYSRVLD